MKNQFIYLLIVLCVCACQIEDENTPKPNESFTKYYGENLSYEAKDLEIIYDASGEVVEGFLIYGSVSTEEVDNDYFVMRMDADGNLVSVTSFGLNQTLDIDGDGLPDDFDADAEVDSLRGNDIPGQIVAYNGGYVAVGTSSITDNEYNISDLRVLTVAYLDANLTLISDSLDVYHSTDGNTSLDLIGNDVIVTSDGGLLIGGSKQFNRSGISDFDNFYMKLDATNSVVFQERQGAIGQGEDEFVVRVFEKSNGNYVFIGYANTPSGLGENGGDNGINAYFLEVNSSGNIPVNSSYFGVDDPDDSDVYNDVVTSAISTASGYAITGTSTTSGNDVFGFMINISTEGVHLSGSSLPGNVFSGLQTRINGITQAVDNEIVLVGQYINFSTTVNGVALTKNGEGMFMKVDQAAVPVTGAEANFGLTDGNDSFADAVTLPDGKIVVVSNIDFGGGIKMISLTKMDDNGKLEN